MNEFRITYAVVAVAVFLITVAAEHFLMITSTGVFTSPKPINPIFAIS